MLRLLLSSYKREESVNVALTYFTLNAEDLKRLHDETEDARIK